MTNARIGSKAIPEEHLRVKISARVNPVTKQYIEDLQEKTGTDNPGRAIDVLAIIARKTLPAAERRVTIFARIDPSTKEFLDKIQDQVGANNIGRALDELVTVVMRDPLPVDSGIKIIA